MVVTDVVMTLLVPAKNAVQRVVIIIYYMALSNDSNTPRP